MAWRVDIHPEANAELAALPAAEWKAIDNAIEKLAVSGDRLGAPHSSSVRGVGGTLRELRPRAGRSRWRASYCRIGDQLLIAAIGPEASVDPRGFRRTVAIALDRLNALDHEEQGDR